MNIDMHMHSSHSMDALTKPETMVKIAKKKGLAIAITDHGTTSAWSEIRKHAEKAGVQYILGEEILVEHDGKNVGEILGYFMNAPVKNLNVFATIDELREQDALIGVAHPFDKFRKPFRMLDEVRTKVDAIEIFNSRGYTGSFNKKAQAYAKKYKIPGTAGSDAHTPGEIGNAYVIAETDDLEEARKLIKAGKTSYYGKIASRTVHLKTQLAKFNIMGDR